MPNHVLKAEPGHFGLVTRPYAPLRCGRCSGRSFQVIVSPEGHVAKVAGALCACGHYYEATEQGYIASTGEITHEFNSDKNPPN